MDDEHDKVFLKVRIYIVHFARNGNGDRKKKNCEATALLIQNGNSNTSHLQGWSFNARVVSRCYIFGESILDQFFGFIAMRVVEKCQPVACQGEVRGPLAHRLNKTPTFVLQ